MLMQKSSQSPSIFRRAVKLQAAYHLVSNDQCWSPWRTLEAGPPVPGNKDGATGGAGVPLRPNRELELCSKIF